MPGVGSDGCGCGGSQYGERRGVRCWGGVSGCWVVSLGVVGTGMLGVELAGVGVLDGRVVDVKVVGIGVFDVGVMGKGGMVVVVERGMVVVENILEILIDFGDATTYSPKPHIDPHAIRNE